MKLDKLCTRVARHHQFLSSSPAAVSPATSTLRTPSGSQNESQGSSCNSAPLEVKRIHFIKITINYHNKFKMQNTNIGSTIICGREVNKLKLATAMIQLTPVQMALKLVACMFYRDCKWYTDWHYNIKGWETDQNSKPTRSCNHAVYWRSVIILL